MGKVWIGCHCYEAEVCRTKDMVLLQQSADHQAAAEDRVQHALKVAPRNKPSPSNDELPQTSLASGDSKGSVRKRVRYLGMFTVGSPKGLTPLTSRKPKTRCWKRWRNATLADTFCPPYIAGRVSITP